MVQLGSMSNTKFSVLPHTALSIGVLYDGMSEWISSLLWCCVATNILCMATYVAANRHTHMQYHYLMMMVEKRAKYKD